MNVEEIAKIIEDVERARDRKEKPIGLTISIIAALLALATVLSHRAHTEEVLVQAKIVDEWSYYTAKHARAHDYGREAAFVFLLPKGADLARRDYEKSIEEQCGDPPGNCKSPVDDPNLQKELSAAATDEAGQTQPAANPERKPVALKGEQKSSEQAASKKKLGALDLLAQVQKHEQDEVTLSHLASSFDAAVVLLEISIVLCSVSLLAASRTYWKHSFVTAGLGVVIMLYGGLLLWFPWLWPHFQSQIQP